MAHSRTAKKNIRQNGKRRAANRAAAATMRTQIKGIYAATAEGNGAAAAVELPRAQKLLDKAAKSNRIHRNKAARLKSKLARAIHSAT